MLILRWWDSSDSVCSILDSFDWVCGCVDSQMVGLFSLCHMLDSYHLVCVDIGFIGLGLEQMNRDERIFVRPSEIPLILGMLAPPLNLTSKKHF
jgi:hypothetical protein